MSPLPLREAHNHCYVQEMGPSWTYFGRRKPDSPKQLPMLRPQVPISYYLARRHIYMRQIEGVCMCSFF